MNELEIAETIKYCVKEHEQRRIDYDGKPTEIKSLGDVAKNLHKLMVNVYDNIESLEVTKKILQNKKRLESMEKREPHFTERYEKYLAEHQFIKERLQLNFDKITSLWIACILIARLQNEIGNSSTAS